MKKLLVLIFILCYGCGGADFTAAESTDPTQNDETNNNERIDNNSNNSGFSDPVVVQPSETIGTGGTNGTGGSDNLGGSGGTVEIDPDCKPKTCESIALELSGPWDPEDDISKPVACDIIDEPDGCGGTITCDPLPNIKADNPLLLEIVKAVEDGEVSEIGWDSVIDIYIGNFVCGGGPYAVDNLLPRYYVKSYHDASCTEAYPHLWYGEHLAYLRSINLLNTTNEIIPIDVWDSTFITPIEYNPTIYRFPYGKECQPFSSGSYASICCK